MNYFERRNEILEVLSQKRKTSIDYLSKRFGVSKITIRRDIDILSLEYPIMAVQGKNGGIYVEDGWKLTRQYLNTNQISVLNKIKNNPRCSKEDKELLESIINDFSAPWMKSGS